MITSEEKYNNLLANLEGKLTPTWFEKLKELKLPTKKHEDWKYSSLSKNLPEKLDMTEGKLRDFDSELSILDNFGHFAIFFNGEFESSISELPIEVSVTKGEEYRSHDSQNPLEILAYSPLSSKTEINIKEGYNSTSPILFLNITQGLEGELINDLITINVDKNANACIYQMHKNLGGAVANSTIVANLGKFSKLEHAFHINDSNETIRHHQVKGHVSDSATYKTINFHTSGRLLRSTHQIHLNEKNASTYATGLYLLNNEMESDHNLAVHHNVGETYSFQLYKGVLTDRAISAFTGKVVIEKNAIQANSEQLNKNLLLNEHSKSYSRPQLEIYNDDVKCAHGATIGQISEEEVFYLQSRGMSLEDAKRSVCKAFAMETIEKIDSSPLALFLEDIIEAKYNKLELKL